MACIHRSIITLLEAQSAGYKELEKVVSLLQLEPISMDKPVPLGVEGLGLGIQRRHSFPLWTLSCFINLFIGPLVL